MLDWNVDHHSSTEAKIALYRDLFRGRDDSIPAVLKAEKPGNMATGGGATVESLFP